MHESLVCINVSVLEVKVLSASRTMYNMCQNCCVGMEFMVQDDLYMCGLSVCVHMFVALNVCMCLRACMYIKAYI